MFTSTKLQYLGKKLCNLSTDYGLPISISLQQVVCKLRLSTDETLVIYIWYQAYFQEHKNKSKGVKLTPKKDRKLNVEKLLTVINKGFLDCS